MIYMKKFLTLFHSLSRFGMEMGKTRGCCGFLLTIYFCGKGKGSTVRPLFCASSCVPVLTIIRIGLVIDRLFEFDIINVKTCPDCKNEAYTLESNISLTVCFEHGAALEDILRETTFGPSTYPDRNCEVCNKKLDTLNIPQLVTGPDILVMQLARFNNQDQVGYVKNAAVISFNEELDLSPYTRGRFALKYRLLSVVQHCGTREFGHYITIAKGPSGEWQNLDDSSASPATGTNPFCPRDEAAFTPYILFWARVDENVAAELAAYNELASTDDYDDDELRPLQIRINGVPQTPSGKHFVKTSDLFKLKQQCAEYIEGANPIETKAPPQVETGEMEKKRKKGTTEEEDEEKKEEERGKEEGIVLKKAKKLSGKEIEEKDEKETDMKGNGKGTTEKEEKDQKKGKRSGYKGTSKLKKHKPKMSRMLRRSGR